MNGTIFEEIKKNGNSKKREKLKTALAIISTNVLVASLFLLFGQNQTAKALDQKVTRIIHPQYKMIIIPLTLIIDFDPSAPETPVTIINKSKKILISKAYIHEMILTSPSNEDGIKNFKIEIPEDQVLQLSAEGPEAMIAIPELKLTTKVKKTINRRVSQYEINL